MIAPLDVIDFILDMAQKSGADAADALLYESSSLSASRRMGKPEDLERSETGGIGLRVFAGKRVASVSASDMREDTLAELVERAVTMAKLSPIEEYASLAPKQMLAYAVTDLDLYDAAEPSPEWLQEQCGLAEDAALAVKGITNSEGASAGYGSVVFSLGTSNGFRGSYKTSACSLSVSVLAGNSADGLERDYDFSSARFVSDLLPAACIGESAGQRALARLHPQKIATGMMPVMFDPRVSKGLLGAFAGGINGAAIARGTSFLKNAMGKQLFHPSIDIIDDPHLPRGLGSKPFDGEGVKNRKASLLEKGVLQSWLLDMRSANKLGLVTTGHASRGLSSPPSPYATNLYMKPGTASPDELISDIASGFYVTEVFGMGVNLITGDYSQGASGFFIENGKKSYAVSEVTIAGKLQDMFMHMTPANDLSFRYAVNAPTLRVEGMTVAGK